MTCARPASNVQETENIIFEGAEAAVARINLDGARRPHALDAMRDNAHVLDVQLVDLSLDMRPSPQP